MLWFYCLVLPILRWLSLLISFDPNFKLAFPGIPVPTRIIQSCPFCP